MGKNNSFVTNLKTLVVGCTPLARDAVNTLDKVSDLVGVVNLDTDKGSSKSNYDSLSDICKPFLTKNINDDETATWMASKDPDIIVQCGWSQIFKPKILNIPNKYCLGIHPSPLPEGRGAAVLNWKIIESNGKPIKWGNSLFVMEAKTDTGGVLDFEPFTIEPNDDIYTAYQKVNRTAMIMLVRTIRKISQNKETIILQNNSEATRYYKRTPEDGKIKLSWSPTKICDYVRALTHPYPGAWIKTKFGKIFLWKVSIDSIKAIGSPGTVNHIIKHKGVSVMVGKSESVLFERISFNGIEQSADQWAVTIGLSKGKNIVS